MSGDEKNEGTMLVPETTDGSTSKHNLLLESEGIDKEKISSQQSRLIVVSNRLPITIKRDS